MMLTNITLELKPVPYALRKVRNTDVPHDGTMLVVHWPPRQRMARGRTTDTPTHIFIGPRRLTEDGRTNGYPTSIHED